MSLPIETRIEPRGEQRRLPGGHQAHDPERDRLHVLVGELLSENQRLRFEDEGLLARCADLEAQTQSAERGLADPVKWAGMMF